MILKIIVILACFSTPLYSAPFPPLKGVCLSGRLAELPAESSGRVCVIVMTFSKDASDAATRWGKALEADFGGDTRVAIYQAAEIEKAPRLVRPLILRAMRKKFSPAVQDKFVILKEDSALWQKTAGYDPMRADDPYLMLISPKGDWVFGAHGEAGSQLRAELASKIAAALGGPVIK